MVPVVEPTPDAPRPHGLPSPAPTPPPGYLDAVAGQPLLPAAQQAWRAAAGQSWSDPARLHHEGRRAGIVLDAARASLAESLGVGPAEVFLTSSGPTALAVAVQGLLESRTAVSRRAVVTAVESMAVTMPVERWSGEVSTVPVDAWGRVDMTGLARELEQPAALVCVQAANGEVGTRQPLAGVSQLTRAAEVPLLVHAIQVIGREAVPDGWDVLAASARDWGGPAGVGVLVVRSGQRWRPADSPDRGWVGGFPDIPGAAAAAAALEYLRPHAAEESARLSGLVDLIRATLPGLVPGITVAGDPVDRLPHIVTITCAGVTGEEIVTELDRRGVAVASGSACTADTRMPSQVLAAMGLDDGASVRISLPLGCTADSVELLLREFAPAVAGVRQ